MGKNILTLFNGRGEIYPGANVDNDFLLRGKYHFFFFLVFKLLISTKGDFLVGREEPVATDFRASRKPCWSLARVDVRKEEDRCLQDDFFKMHRA